MAEVLNSGARVSRGAYIALGSVALGKSTPMAVRKVSFVAALLCVTYLVCVAHTRSPLLGLSY